MALPVFKTAWSCLWQDGRFDSFPSPPFPKRGPAAVHIRVTELPGFGSQDLPGLLFLSLLHQRRGLQPTLLVIVRIWSAMHVAILI